MSFLILTQKLESSIYIKWKKIGSEILSAENLYIELEELVRFLNMEAIPLPKKLLHKEDKDVFDELIKIAFPIDATQGVDSDFSYLLCAYYLIDQGFYIFKFKTECNTVKIIGGNSNSVESIELDESYISSLSRLFLCVGLIALIFYFWVSYCFWS